MVGGSVPGCGAAVRASVSVCVITLTAAHCASLSVTAPGLHRRWQRTAPTPTTIVNVRSRSIAAAPSTERETTLGGGRSDRDR